MATGRDTQVLLDGERGEQLAIVGNEHDARPAGRGCPPGLQLVTVDRDRPVVRSQEPGDGEQQRRLARAVGTENRMHRAPIHREIEVTEGGE